MRTFHVCFVRLNLLSLLINILCHNKNPFLRNRKQIVHFNNWLKKYGPLIPLSFFSISSSGTCLIYLPGIISISLLFILASFFLKTISQKRLLIKFENYHKGNHPKLLQCKCSGRPHIKFVKMYKNAGKIIKEIGRYEFY